MLKTVLVLAFGFGVIVGMGVSLLLNLLFWGAVGLVLVLAFDCIAGLSPRVTALRVRVRALLARLFTRRAPVYRKHIWVNI